MTVFFIIAFIVTLFARLLFGAFVDKVAVGFGIFSAVFIGIEIYNKIKRK